jgi:hypothetical protein
MSNPKIDVSDYGYQHTQACGVKLGNGDRAIYTIDPSAPQEGRCKAAVTLAPLL